MKICIVSDAYYPYPSGVSEYTFYVAKYLRKRGHKVRILTTHYPRIKGVRGEETERGVFRVGRVFLIPANKSYATPTIGFGISRIVKNFIQKENFDVLHLHTPIFPGLSYFALRHSKSANVAVFHSTGFKPLKLGANYFKRVFRKSLSKIHQKIAISPSAKNHINSYFGEDFNIIPCGVDIEKFSSSSKKINLPPRGPKILYFGRIDRRKGLFELLESFPLILKKFPKALLIVAGSGPLEKKAKKIAKKIGISKSVIFKGFIPAEKVPSYYASCDVYCSPALGGESFGIVLIEAMASGIPVVASKIVGYDFVIKDGYNGLFCDPKSSKDIASKVLNVLENRKLSEMLVENAKNFVRNYSWEIIVEQIEKVYFRALAISKSNKL